VQAPSFTSRPFRALLRSADSRFLPAGRRCRSPPEVPFERHLRRLGRRLGLAGRLAVRSRPVRGRRPISAVPSRTSGEQNGSRGCGVSLLLLTEPSIRGPDAASRPGSPFCGHGRQSPCPCGGHRRCSAPAHGGAETCRFPGGHGHQRRHAILRRLRVVVRRQVSPAGPVAAIPDQRQEGVEAGRSSTLPSTRYSYGIEAIVFANARGRRR
jgi:hypothetical protein